MVVLDVLVRIFRTICRSWNFKLRLRARWEQQEGTQLQPVTGQWLDLTDIQPNEAVDGSSVYINIYYIYLQYIEFIHVQHGFDSTNQFS